MELQPYQVEGATFLSKQSAMLADEPGLGKTAQAIRACDLVDAKSVLVLCPHIAKVHWAREFEQWQLRQRSINPKGPFPAGVHIVNYDLISRDEKRVTELASIRWDVLILDEAHYLKNREAKRTRAVYKRLRKRAGKVWALTGTPAPNHAGELWPHLYHLADGFEDYYRFRDKYCKIRHTPFGDQIVGSKNMRDLRSRMNGFVLRRKKKDVLTQLLPLRFVVEPVSVYNMSVEDRTAWRQLDQRIGDAYEDIVKNLRRAELALATERRMLGMLKVGVAAQYIDNELADNSRKLIVFAVHHDVLDSLAQRLQAYNPVQIDGRTSAADRQAAIDRFQTDPKCRLFIGQITAAGTAITLTASSDVLFVEAAWTPADNYQAACRAHRIGQNEGVLARFLTTPGSMDDLVMRILVRKATELSELFD